MLEPNKNTLNLDMFPVLSLCVSCGHEIKYPPLRMPKGPPIVNPSNPFHMSIEYVDMCVYCVEAQLNTLKEKIKRGEMYPSQSWQLDENEQPHIVSISSLLPQVQAQAIETEVGLVRTAIRYCIRLLKKAF